MQFKHPWVVCGWFLPAAASTRRPCPIRWWPVVVQTSSVRRFGISSRAAGCRKGSGRARPEVSRVGRRRAQRRGTAAACRRWRGEDGRQRARLLRSAASVTVWRSDGLAAIRWTLGYDSALPPVTRPHTSQYDNRMIIPQRKSHGGNSRG